jgi:hypothetical protein
MLRPAALLVFGAVLAACSGSNRLADAVPSRANTATHTGALQYQAQEKRAEGRSKSDAKPQETKIPDAESPPQE